ncbi:hypothetical protein [Lutimonas zeaxanthinifaciens]|uniref:hypothetical protein n=1 Tax=Lutimonas zeaxanthinifaciens TaxID=3060215 RepID=UPI00265D484C|nr:hypothetical protein [Lutimonas sp. YSD2104]WKK66663.1 hypothetical protein QZH61_03365 [Lutimonas sp. YSD2104]
MVKKYSITLLTIIAIISPFLLHAQKDQIPLETTLAQASERQLIKIGMITQSKPAKLKFGVYSTDNRKGRHKKEGDDATELLFSFDLKNNKGDLVKIEASGNQEESNTSKKTEGQDDISVYLTTSLDEEDLWVLLITKPRDGGDLSLKNIFLTNGEEEIVFKHVKGTPTNKSENTAPKGIEAFIDDYPIGAMQYYSGGSFSYKKFIWISGKTETQTQLIMAAVFSSLLEVADYFQDLGFTD